MADQNPIVTFTMENGDTMKAELYPEVAPNTVNNFISLVKKGFYDGLIFHRIISGFMIQGGDPDGTGMGGPGYSIKGEFSYNGVDNNLKHSRGVLSMARAQHPDSAGSQFFIMHANAPHLDGQYAAFGKLIEGEDVLDSIVAKNVQVTTPVVGDKFTLTNADCTIMATDTKDTEENLNLSSIVIRMTYGGNSFLFMGDAEAEVEEARNWQPADVLKVGHHGSKTSSTQNFIMQVMPSIAIIQVGKDNSYNLPNQETIDKLNAVGTKIYRTDESGTIKITCDGKENKVEFVKFDN